MNFDLDDDQRDIQRSAREMLAARFKLEEVRRLALEEERGFTEAQWQEMVDLGWPDLLDDLGMVELAVIAEELGYALAPTPLQSHWAAVIAAGPIEGRGTVGYRDGDSWLVPYLDSADVVVLGGAKLEGLVEGERVEALDPTRPLFRVQADGGGAEADDRALVLLAAENVGIAQHVMEMSVAYASERKQFGRPIGTNQAVSHQCAQMLLEVEGARALVYNAAWALDHDPKQAPLASAMAKAWASDAGPRVVSAAIQVHGGIGFTWEHDLHFFLKRAEANALALGGAREQRARVAALVFD
ncbi:MAG: acyl-CoA dehydrogenase family protein [Solirubrobacteraceae bacterium]